MAYGFEMYDSDGDLAFTHFQTDTMLLVADVTATLYPTGLSGNYVHTAVKSVPGVSSQADLDANYIIAERASWFYGPSEFTITYHSSGNVLITNDNSCKNLDGTSRDCTTADLKQGQFKIYALGKDI
jgi:hypothetical protein|tara:strand:- start:1598 stop:1978 length:381 start_codon:yes stop_codon:yes gene_type:complete